MESKIEKKLLILYIDCTDEEIRKMHEDLFFALSCVTQYRFVITNKRMDSLTKKDLLELAETLVMKLKPLTPSI